MSDFNKVVAEWLRLKGWPAVESVVEVEGTGTDWAGSTEAGFAERFDVRIKYIRPSGSTRTVEVVGDDMESLWRHVVRSWPS